MRDEIVWDRFVRSFHWSLVGCVATNLWLLDDGGRLHRGVGYAACGLIAARLLWGFVGTPHARFTDWWPTPSRLRAYVGAGLRAPRHLGHNPLGALMMLVLMALVLGLGFTGWLMRTDAYFGEAWVESLHAALAELLLGLVAVHVSAAVAMSLRHRENLIAAMVHGRKRVDADPAG